MDTKTFILYVNYPLAAKIAKTIKCDETFVFKKDIDLMAPKARPLKSKNIIVTEKFLAPVGAPGSLIDFKKEITMESKLVPCAW
jgi:hypothetical protein